MQIDITFACRSCGNRSIITWDTAYAGDPVTLACSRCRHVSGDLTPDYHYRESDPPPSFTYDESAYSRLAQEYPGPDTIR